MKATLSTITILTLALSSHLNAQVQHTEIIEGNNVKATVGDEGVFFNDDQNGTANYEVPAGSGKKTVYAGYVWAAAQDAGGSLYVAANIYPNQITWRSGPIADASSYGSVAYNTLYGKSIWKVTRQDVDDHLQQYQQAGYTPSAAIGGWPGNGSSSLGVAAQLAPFYDANGDGTYSPMDGDYPDFPGDEVVYTIINDESYQAQPDAMGLELHMMFYQFNDSGYLSETTFLNIRTFNRSATSYFDFKQSLFLDFDIGNFSDDYMGSDSTRNLLYAYNGDQFDETNGGAAGYETTPPCQAVMSLNKNALSAMTYGLNGQQSPVSDAGIWNAMNGIQANGTAMINPITASPTKFSYSGNPFTGVGWTEFNNNNGGANPPNDRRGILSVDMGSLPSGSMVCNDYAFIFDDAGSYLENVQNVMNIADAVQVLYDSNADFPCGAFMAGVQENPELEFNLYPNPSYGTVYLTFENTLAPVSVQVHDISGRLVYSETVTGSSTSIYLQEETGFYTVTLTTDNGLAQKTLILK